MVRRKIGLAILAGLVGVGSFALARKRCSSPEKEFRPPAYILNDMVENERSYRKQIGLENVATHTQTFGGNFYVTPLFGSPLGMDATGSFATGIEGRVLSVDKRELAYDIVDIVGADKEVVRHVPVPFLVVEAEMGSARKKLLLVAHEESVTVGQRYNFLTTFSGDINSDAVIGIHRVYAGANTLAEREGYTFQKSEGHNLGVDGFIAGFQKIRSK